MRRKSGQAWQWLWGREKQEVKHRNVPYRSGKANSRQHPWCPTVDPSTIRADELNGEHKPELSASEKKDNLRLVNRSQTKNSILNLIPREI
jgi:hypothetical protein